MTTRRVFLGYACGPGRTLLDRELYLPIEWALSRPTLRSRAAPPRSPLRTVTTPKKRCLPVESCVAQTDRGQIRGTLTTTR
jgi:hypothetical protein